MIFRAYSSVTLKENNSFTELFHKKLLDPEDPNSSKYRVIYAVKMGIRGKPLPKDIANIIKKSVDESATYAYNLKAHGKPVDEEYVKKLSQNIAKSRWYAKLLFDLGEPVPSYILDSVASNPGSSAEMARYLLSTDINNQLSSVEGNLLEIKRKKALPVPEVILKSVAYDPLESYLIAQSMARKGNFNIPEILLQSLKKVPGAEEEIKNYLNKRKPKKKG